MPLVLLAMLLTIGTRSKTQWRENLEKLQSTRGIDERFSSVSSSELPFIEGYSGEWGRHGLTLKPGAEGYVRMRLGNLPGTEVLVRMWAYDYGACRVRWWNAGEDPASARVLSQSGSIVGRGFRLHGRSDVSAIILEVSGKNCTSRRQILFDRISVSSSVYRPINGWITGCWIWGAVCVVFWWAGAKKQWWAPPGGIVLWTAGLAVVLIGVTLRLNLLSFLNGVPLDPDVRAYQNYAAHLQWLSADNGFYSASFGEREPLWIAVLQLWQLWVGNGDLAVRLLTILLSSAVIALTGVFLWHWLRDAFWVVAGMLMASLNPSLIQESCRALRSEMMTIGFIAFLMVSLPIENRRFHPLIAGTMVGLWALLRGAALGIAFGLWAVLWLMTVISRRYNVRPWIPKGYNLLNVLLAVFISLSLFVPHLYGFHERYGDWRWPSYGYARWNANMEFQDRLGTPGFPTREEFEKTPYAGPRISYSQYMFGMHTPSQIVRYQLMGWIELLGYQSLSLSPHSRPLALQLSPGNIVGSACLLGPSLVFAICLGCIAFAACLKLLWDKKLWWAPVMLLWGTSYAAFLYHARLVEPIRHTVHVYPLLVLVTIWGMRWRYNSERLSRVRNYVWNCWFRKPR